MKDYYTKDYYHILGVGGNAGLDEIKQSYRSLAKKYHPDRAGGDKYYEERFKEILEAYKVLIDPAQRQEYDEWRRRNAAAAMVPVDPYPSRKKAVLRPTGQYAAYSRARKVSIAVIFLISIGILIIILMVMATPRTYSTLQDTESYPLGIPPPAETDMVPAVPSEEKNKLIGDIQDEINIIQDTVNQKYDDFEKEISNRRPEEWEKKSLDMDIEKDIQWRLKWREKEKEMQEKYVEEWNRKQEEQYKSQ